MSRMIWTTLVGLGLATTPLADARRTEGAELPPVAARTIDFVRDVRPLLEKHCWSCHGAKEQESGLRLDRRDALLAGGDLGKVVVPGKSAESRLIHLIAGSDPKNVMPPEGDRLSSEAIGVLRAWIDQGCQWPDAASAPVAKNMHWAYQPLTLAPPPVVKNAVWSISPIDRYVLAALEKRGLAPSPPADRYTLVRRLHLDLIGLPPTIAEVDAFVQDTSSNAYEKLVDRLLASKHFGERWGRHWLDMARYADSDGFEKDNARPDAYRWRDWVIDAINADMPFDQFTVEQLAGDLLPGATPMQQLATAFHRQTLTNTEGGTDQEQWRVEACFDRTETTGAVWLGLTVGCARCHSHKYDAISQREYYQMFAVFNNGDEKTTTVPKSQDEVAAYAKALAAHEAALAEVTTKLHAEQQKFGPALAAWEAKTQEELARIAVDPIRLHALDKAVATGDAGLTFAAQKDGSVLVGGANPETAVYTIVGQTAVGGVTAIRLDALADPSLPAKGPGRVKHGNFVLTDVVAEVASTADFADARKLEFASAQADWEQDGKFPARDALDGKDDTGWAISPQMAKDHWAVFTLKAPLEIAASSPAASAADELLNAAPAEGKSKKTPKAAAGKTGDAAPSLFVRVTLRQQYGKQHTLGRFKLSLQTGSQPPSVIPANVVKALATTPAKRKPAEQQLVLDHFSSLQSPTRELIARREELVKKTPVKPELTVRVVAQRTQDPRKTFVLKRGEFLEPLKDLEVQPGGPTTLPPMESRTPNQPADRLDLARWLVRDDNPLTPRVTVNHFWRILFGAGIVRTVNDFGVRGERPTHPELLDWLAAEFVRPGADAESRSVLDAAAAGVPVARPWSRKTLLKRIVMSAVYQQSSVLKPEHRELDPQNNWLARQNRLRVEGEIVRDASLDVAGLLSRKVGGPSVFPPLPPGIAELSYAGNFKWNVSTGEDRFRRGMYTFFKRTSPHPNLTTFDCPDANLTCVERRTSNTPLQALTSLNNEQFSETSRAFAKRLLATPAADDAARLTEAFRLCVARPPHAYELQELAALLADARAWYRQHPDLAKPLVADNAAPGVAVEENASWIATARIVLNLDEFITRE